jgi:hypothetical protein
MNVFYELQQNARTGAAEATSARSASRVESMARRVDDLEERLNRLTLINVALWSLLEEQTPLTEEDLSRRVQEIDLADGKVDGKLHAQLEPCPRCGQTLSKRHRRCLHCGYEPPPASAFDAVAR